MKALFAAAGLALGASAAIIPRQQCCFSLVSNGEASGAVTQLSDGQNRVPNGTSGNSASATASSPATATTPASYCINNGAITDAQGRGCIITGPTTQFQCDAGATPQSGFSVTSNGDLSFEGSSVFYACAASDQEDNVYVHTSAAVTNCHQISLSTNGQCVGSSAGSSSASSSASRPSSSSIASSAPDQSLTASGLVGAPSSVVGTSTAAAQSASSVETWSAVWTFPASISAPSHSTPRVSPDTSVQSPTYSSSRVESTILRPSSSAQTQSAPSRASTSVIASESSVQAQSASWQVSTPVITTESSVETQSASSQTSTSEVVPRSSVSVSASTVASSASGTSSTQVAQSSTAQATTHSTVAAVTSATSTSQLAPTSAAVTTSAVHSSQAASASGSPTVSGSACQTSLTGAYQTPHLIVPISSTSPNTAFGTSYSGQINSTTSTIFNFDIPQNYAGKQCSIIFLFPEQSQLQTSSYTFSNSGSIDFARLSSAVTQQTTWSNVPSVQSQLNTISIQPGNDYVVATQSCQAGTTESIELSSVGGLSLNFFEDWNPASLGLYITSC